VAERALPAGSSRRRVLFGALDADGWTWAGIRAFGWFLLLVLLLGYIPDRAYYFTVFPTVDIGANIASPINLCPPGNGDLPCPAPKGAVVPWQGNPAELSLPEGRTDAAVIPAGTNLYLVGGRGPSGASSTVFVTTVSADGNLAPWKLAKPLPAARTAASVVVLSGTTLLLGGADQSGAATDTVYEAVVSNGSLTDWKARPDLKLPVPLAGATVVAGTNSIWLIGGQGADQSYSRKVYRSVLNSSVNPPTFGPWQEQSALVLPAGRALAFGAQVGNYLYVIGGQDAHGAQAGVFRLQLDAAGDPAVDPTTKGVLGWSASTPTQSLPEARSDAAGFVSNGGIYIVGGSDAAGRPTGSFYWTVPDASGNVPGGWQRLQADNLPANGPRIGAAAVVTSGQAFVIGGTGDKGPSVATFRANVAPAPPFFALGLVGATVPALSIKGDIGQQLGYLDAAIVGGTNFALLVLVGVAFSHRRGTRRLFSRLTRGRVRPPVDDTYAD
jgi:hypothetical protein